MKCILCENQIDNRRRRCPSCNTKIRRYRTKIRAQVYLGGKCKECGHKGPHYHFDFHHRDTNKKEFQLGNVANKSWNSIVEELDKCDLLCVFCHRKKHRDVDEAFWNEVINYQGKEGEWLTEEIKQSILDR